MVARCISQVKVILILQPEGAAWISGCDSQSGEEKCRRQPESNPSTTPETRSQQTLWWQYKATGKGEEEGDGLAGQHGSWSKGISGQYTEGEQ